MSILDVTDSNFEREIHSDLVLVDFWAPWCGPCKMLSPILDELHEELGNKVKIIKVDVDVNTETYAKYNIMSVPTLILFKNGEKVDGTTGFQPKETLIEMIEKHI